LSNCYDKGEILSIEFSWLPAAGEIRSKTAIAAGSTSAALFGAAGRAFGLVFLVVVICSLGNR
jgi:hypothetical protein